MVNSAANSTLPDARPPILIAAVLLVSAAMVMRRLYGDDFPTGGGN